MFCRFIVSAALCSFLYYGLSLSASAQTSGSIEEKQPNLRKDGESSFYKRWLEEDVRWIISNEERAAFKMLSTNEEMDLFIEQFWARRDPTPDTLENEFEDEHYRRIVFANEKFASNIPGWKTDRGRVYIRFGPPDKINVHSFPEREPNLHTPGPEYPYEEWQYAYLEGIRDVSIKFMDTCSCGEYRMVPAIEENIFSRLPGNETTTPIEPSVEMVQSFTGLTKYPEVRFKDLEELVAHKIKTDLVRFKVHTEFVKATEATDVMRFSLQIKNRDVHFVTENHTQRASVNIFGRVSTLTGRIVSTFEDSFHIDVQEGFSIIDEETSRYQKMVALPRNVYRLDVIVADTNADRVGSWNGEIRVH